MYIIKHANYNLIRNKNAYNPVRYKYTEIANVFKEL